MRQPFSLFTLLLIMSSSAFATEPATALAEKEGYDRRAAISHFADTLWSNDHFSVDQGVDLLQGLTGTDRYFSTKSLFGANRHARNLLPEQLSANEIGRLLEGIGPQREEMIQYLTDYGIPAPNLGVNEIQSLMGTVSRDSYERPLRALLGSNRLKQNYGLPTFGVDEAEELISRGSDRAGMIRYFADHALLTGSLSVTEAEKMIGTESPMARHDAIKALLGSNHQQVDYLTLPLQYAESAQLINGSALPETIIRYFSDHGVFAGNLSADESQQLLEQIHHTDRFNVVKSLLGENQQQKSYLQLPLDATDAVKLLDGMAYRDEMIGLMSDQRVLRAPLSTEEVHSLLGALSRADRHDALSALLGNNEPAMSYLQLPIDASAANTLLEESAYRHELIQQMSDIGALRPMGGEEATALVDELVGEARHSAIAALSGLNGQQRHYFTQPLNSSELSALLHRSADPLKLIQQLLQQQLVQPVETTEALELLLEPLYGEERKEAMKLLTH